MKPCSKKNRTYNTCAATTAVKGVLPVENVYNDSWDNKWKQDARRLKFVVPRTALSTEADRKAAKEAIIAKLKRAGVRFYKADFYPRRIGAWGEVGTHYFAIHTSRYA